MSFEQREVCDSTFSLCEMDKSAREKAAKRSNKKRKGLRKTKGTEWRKNKGALVCEHAKNCLQFARHLGWHEHELTQCSVEPTAKVLWFKNADDVATENLRLTPTKGGEKGCGKVCRKAKIMQKLTVHQHFVWMLIPKRASWTWIRTRRSRSAIVGRWWWWSREEAKSSVWLN